MSTAPDEASAPETQPGYRPLTVSGRWFIPTLFVGILLFTAGMIYGTRALASAMAPALRRRGIEAEKADIRRQMEAREAQSRAKTGAERR